ncbi:MAG TPA: SRPBCC family protein [Solirubrobacteraceae bacterium]|jgi:uncharacterized membrane protein|nr:SRPBCC family protein [Solirubrobacteraceae bacterium]
MSVGKSGSAAPADPLARGLGVFSLTLGLPQIAAPGRVNRLIGVRDDATTRMWMRIVGAREIAAGVGIFSTRRPKGWVWARVAGDTLDLALLGLALRGRSDRPNRTLAAAGAVAGAFAADVLDGVRLSRGTDGAQEQQPEQQPEAPIHLRAAITVNRDRNDLYALWRDFEGLPRFMAHLDEVRAGDDGRSHWTAHGPMGMTVSWEAETTEDVPGERIAWRSLEGAKVHTSGTVRFVPAPGDQGTEVHLEMRYELPGGAIGSMLAKLFGEEPAIQVKDDMRRFKQIAETGEVVRSDATPEGALGRRVVKQRPAKPLAEEQLAEVGAEGAS